MVNHFPEYSMSWIFKWKAGKLHVTLGEMLGKAHALLQYRLGFSDHYQKFWVKPIRFSTALFFSYSSLLFLPLAKFETNWVFCIDG